MPSMFPSASQLVAENLSIDQNALSVPSVPKTRIQAVLQLPQQGACI